MLSSHRLFSIATLLLFLGALTVSAGTLLDLTFDDPKGLLSAHPEGLTRLTPAFAASTATITSGSGGRALPQITEGPVSEQNGRNDEARLQVLAEPPIGSKPFFRASLEGGSVTRSAGLGILPGRLETSLNALVHTVDQRTKIDGGCDFFFRMTAASGSPKFVLMARVAQMSVTVTALPEERRLAMKVSSSKKSLDTDGDGQGDKAALEKRVEGGLDSGVIYHGALVFRTAPDGSLAVDFCLQPGIGPLDPANTVVMTISDFWLPAEAPSAGADKVVINIGRSETSPQTLDLAAFRIFAPLPAIFPALEGDKP